MSKWASISTTVMSIFTVSSIYLKSFAPFPDSFYCYFLFVLFCFLFDSMDIIAGWWKKIANRVKSTNKWRVRRRDSLIWYLVTGVLWDDKFMNKSESQKVRAAERNIENANECECVCASVIFKWMPLVPRHISVFISLHALPSHAIPCLLLLSAFGGVQYFFIARSVIKWQQQLKLLLGIPKTHSVRCNCNVNLVQPKYSTHTHAHKFERFNSNREQWWEPMEWGHTVTKDPEQWQYIS